MKTLLAGLAIAATLGAQPKDFDVATVRRSPSASFGAPLDINLGTYRNGTLTMANVTLAECLQFADGLVSQEQVVGPDWIKSRETRFDIVAKAPPDTELNAARQMLRRLLADRLKLVTHVEHRPFAFRALVPARNGARLVPALEGERTPGSGIPGHIVGRQMPVASLASLLSRFEGQLVVDRTGLTGRYQVSLDWAPADSTRNGPSLSEALEEQLGLRLERRREPLDVDVVERADRVPADN